ncbi:MAG TPA: hypothetical protein VEK36_00730 [Candidatus Paceibacterota bacterium]|nr:hypothetical protein [Candidatus Paceibacterota bacterium]
MNRAFQILFLFLITIVIGLIFQALFGFKEQFSLLVFFITAIIYWGLQPALIIPMLTYGVIGDALLGLPLGLSALSFFITMLGLFTMQRFVEIRPLARNLVPRFGSSFIVTFAAAGIIYTSFLFLYAKFDQLINHVKAPLLIFDSQFVLYSVSITLICLMLLLLTEKKVGF